MSKDIELNGAIEDVFGHRFTITSNGQKFLVDLGPHGDGGAKVEVGQSVSVKGEEKPGEIKASSLRVGDGDWLEIKHKDHAPKPADKGHESKPEAPKSTDGDNGAKPDDTDKEQGPSDDHVTKTLTDEGYTDIGERTRKPKHVEVIASKDGKRHKVHVHKDGVKKTEPAD